MSTRVSPPTPSKERPVTAPSAAGVASSSSSSSSSSSNNHSEERENAAASERGANVQVVVRCRPPNENEKKANDAVIVGVNQKDAEVHVLLNKNKAVLSNAAGSNVFQSKDIPKKTYTFDQTYGQFSTQEEVYNAAVKPLVDEVLNGYNCTVFAYGQTGTGKNHSFIHSFIIYSI